MSKSTVTILVVIVIALVLCCCVSSSAAIFISRSKDNTLETPSPTPNPVDDAPDSSDDSNGTSEQSDLPSETPADNNLEGSRGDDTLKSDVAGYVLALDVNYDTSTCKSRNIKEVSFVEYTTEPTFDENNLMLTGKWQERWTVNRCGNAEVTYELNFTADGVGGTYYTAQLLN